jgi:hypothetical protein
MLVFKVFIDILCSSLALLRILNAYWIQILLEYVLNTSWFHIPSCFSLLPQKLREEKKTKQKKRKRKTNKALNKSTLNIHNNFC